MVLLKKKNKNNKDQIKSQEIPEDIDLYSDECERIAYSDEYFDILVPFGNVDQLVQQYNAKCYRIIDDLFVILSISVSEYRDLARDLRTVEVPILYGPYARRAMEASGILYYHTEPVIPLRGNGIVIGIVDSGIDYTHRVFINEDGTTKIRRIWDQTIPGNPPEGFNFGTEYTMEQINEALNSGNPYDVVKTVDTSGHGTFLAGIAAGREVIEEDFVGAAPEAELIIVKLKEAKNFIKKFFFVENVNQVYQSTDIIQGLKYLINMAVGLRKPLVISFGLGSNLGAHDGNARLENYIGVNSQRRGSVIVVPSGNEAIAGHHYKGLFGRDETIKEVEINIEEGERGVYFSLWCEAPDKLSISILSPLGGYIERIPIKFSYVKDIKLPLEQTTISVIYEISEALAGEQLIFVRMTNPTPGIWTVTVYGEVIVNGEFDMWLPREGWVKPETRFLQPDPFTTVTIPGTAQNAFTIGGYDARTDSIYKASGRGLTWDDELKPNIVAPSVNVFGPLPGNTFGTMTGTSIGTAITGGASALLLEWGVLLGNAPEMDTWIARNFLVRGAQRKPNIDYPNRIWGYGELNLIGTFDSLKGIRL